MTEEEILLQTIYDWCVCVCVLLCMCVCVILYIFMFVGFIFSVIVIVVNTIISLPLIVYLSTCGLT